MNAIKQWLIIFGGAYLLFALIIFTVQRKFIYYPAPQDFYNCPNLPGAETVVYKGTRMYVQESTSKWVVIYHGNAGSACDRSYFLNYFKPINYSYIIVEYTGYSNDQGPPSQEKLMRNVEDAVDFLKSQNPSQVTVVGESIGAALAAFHSSLNKPHKLLLIAGFDSLANAAKAHYWFLPIGLILLDNYPAKEWVKSAENVLVIHGSDDEIIPVGLGKVLYRSIASENKNFMEVAGANHNDIYDYPQTDSAIRKFFQITE